jgi:hypothetical protein
LLCPGTCEVLQRHACAVLVTGFIEEGDGILVGADGLLAPAVLPKRQAEVAQCHGFANPRARPDSAALFCREAEPLAEPR